jgi:2-methylcitrate dehydratase PrpD
MNSRSDSSTRQLAAFTVGAANFPPLARSRAVDAITDCIGCMVAGTREALAGPLLRVLPSADAANGSASAALVGTGRFAAPPDAALFNGTAAHALDYDDTNHPAYAHPSAVLVPTLLALAADVQARGSDLVTAYIIGLEVFGKLGRALNVAHYKRGWHATCTFGTLAATAAASRLLGLDEQRTIMALGIAASSASGLRANFGSMVKPLHAGQAARNGVLATLLAREGFVASETVLEHRYGYCAVFNDGIDLDLEPLAAFGDPLEILTDYGIALKMFPSCGATHPGIEAALEIHRELDGARIRAVRAGVCEMALAPLIYVMPNTALEGKFSMHYCLAAALVDGVVNLSTFTDAKVADPRIRALISRIDMEVDERVRDESEFPTAVRVQTESGRILERMVLLAIGKPDRWLTATQLYGKFAECASRALSPAQIDEVFQRLRALDSASIFDARVPVSSGRSTDEPPPLATQVAAR